MARQRLHLSAVLAAFLAAALLGLLPLAANAADPFAANFTDATLRIDLDHTGNADEEIVALDRLQLEGPWAGPRLRLVDTLDLGRYRARLLDAATGELLWSRGYDAYFGEWKTTTPAGQGVRRTYHESVRCPLPQRAAVLAVDHRGADNQLHEVFRADLDPQGPAVHREPLDADLVTVEAYLGGPLPQCVDVVILGEGYTKDDTAKFTADVKRFAAMLLGAEPFASLKDRLNVRGVLKPS